MDIGIDLLAKQVLVLGIDLKHSGVLVLVLGIDLGPLEVLVLVLTFYKLVLLTSGLNNPVCKFTPPLHKKHAM